MLRKETEKFLSEEEMFFCEAFEEIFSRLGMERWTLNSSEKQDSKTEAKIVNGRISIYQSSQNPSIILSMSGRIGIHSLMIEAKATETDQTQRAYIDGKPVETMPFCKGYGPFAERIQEYLDSHPDIEEQFLELAG